MIIRGFQKTTLLDYPGHVAATVFVGGCNMRCVFCHNMNLVSCTGSCTGGETAPELPCDYVLSHLKKRSGVLDGVCITGGEPTLYSDLPDFISHIKALNLLVKLDTNGTNPDMLKSLIDAKCIDYVSMDIKSSLDKYDEICGVKCDTGLIKRSIDILMASPVEYEFRTTVVSEYHDKDEIQKLSKLLANAKRYYLQPFVDSEFVPDHTLHAPDIEALKEYVKILNGTIKSVQIRGAE